MRLDYAGKIQSASLISATEDEDETDDDSTAIAADEAESPASMAS